ncbi:MULTISPECIES: glycosyltransferase family 4 protein [Cyanophyceae]|uniref:glycosyltransferase family 4 protein n=1 Tax=Cyanophyceae TaxID=3028117 RepID=UPI00168980D3|nr:glycosyltransferase family 1 protein [Trichocoleus sp. FACHB-69]MBD1935687.1 glycosyltransferase family 4 protein [Trichocoleus sp. FACHB-69]
MLKLVIDATPVQPKPSGVGLYVANLIRYLYLLQNQGDIHFQLGIVYQPGMKNWLRSNLSCPKLLAEYSNLYVMPLPVRISNPLFLASPKIFQSYFEPSLNYPNIIHGTNYFVYPCKKSKKVMTLYDLTFIKYPHYINSVVKEYANRVRECLKWTDLVITISESSKRDIVEYLEVNPNRVYVTPLASRYYPEYLSDLLAEEIIAKGERAASQVRFQPDGNENKYDFSKPYLLFVSTIEPRKNITNLIAAFNYLKQTYKIEHQLVLVGQKGWHYEPIFAEIEGSAFQSEIHHLDYLSDEMVALFYSKADAFVYPSHYEGFGLPVLEAMTLGTPVITSNTSSLPEVVGDAALLVDPNDAMGLAEAILQVISDSQFRQELIKKGKERAKMFSWERTARETLKAYKLLF